MLGHTDRSIAEFALECGFSNQPHLKCVFKEFTGIRPKAFRSGAR